MASNRPSATELLQTLHTFLGQAARADADASGGLKALQYQLRIAAGISGMVEREQRLGPEQWQQERQRLAQWCDTTSNDPRQINAELCRRIRAGELDTDTDLLQHLRLSTADKLRIDNPRYSTLLAWEAERAKP